MDQVKKDFFVTSLDLAEFTLIEDYEDSSEDDSFFADDTCESDLEGTDLEGTDLERSDLEGTDLEQEEPVEKIIKRIKSIDNSTRQEVIYNYSTVEYISVIFGLLFIINQILLLMKLIN